MDNCEFCGGKLVESDAVHLDVECEDCGHPNVETMSYVPGDDEE